MKRVLGEQDLRLLRPLRTLGDLESGFHGFGAGRTEEDHVEITGRDHREVSGESGRVLAQESDRDLVAPLVLETLASFDDARMIVAEGERSEPAKEVEDLTAVLIDVVHALRTLDFHAIEPEKLHEVELAWIEMRLEEVRHRGERHSLRILDGKKVRLQRFGYEGRWRDVNVHSAGSRTVRGASSSRLARYSR